MLNRNQAPSFHQIGDVKFLHPQKKELSNGIPVFIFNAGEQELLRIEFIFENVNFNIEKPLQGISASGLINSGTSKLSAQEIAEKVDYYGAFMQTDYNSDWTSVSLYTLNKHLNAVLPIIYAVLNEAIYPQSELDIYCKNHQQRLQVSLMKNDYLARKTFANTIFSNSIYGVDIQLKDYDNLLRDDITEYYNAAYQIDNCNIIIAGKISDKEFKVLDDIFGASWKKSSAFNTNTIKLSNIEPSEIFIDRQDSVQSAIRMGNLSINRNHKDFAALQVLNCVLGGYFGSRLMSNIREDKGFTYGIGSAVVALKQAGYFFIATEVGTQVCEQALLEIEKEINLLREELISENELSLVKNYMMGSLLGSLENVFSHADKFKNIHFSGLDYSYYSNYINTVKSISAEEINLIANQYLDWNKMTKVVVGKQ